MKNHNEIKGRNLLRLIRRSLFIVILAVVNTGMAQFVPWTQVFDFNSLSNSPGDGWNPNTIVISGNVIYGTTFLGNTNINGDPPLQNDGTGTIYKINTDGTSYTDLHDFSSDTNDFMAANSDGANPLAGLLQSSNILYGTASLGGPNGQGAIFRIDTNGENFVTIYGFPDSDAGINPKAALILSNNVLYGTAEYGGGYEDGTVFKVNTDGTGFADLHDFSYYDNLDPDGTQPMNSLVLYSNTLYGTTFYGGSGSYPGGGVIFSVNTDGSDYSILHNFTTSGGTNSDGSDPDCNLTLVSNVLYGTTSSGGINGDGTIFKINPDGTGFTTLFNFPNNSSGGSLTFANGRFYGLELTGVFIINTDGSGYSTLNTFFNGAPSSNGTILSSLFVYGNTIYAIGVNNNTATNNGDTLILAIGPSQPVINNIVLNTNDSVTLSCSGSPYFTYLMQSTTNLASPILWETISTNVADSNGDWQFTDNRPTNQVYETLTNFTYSGGGSPNPGSSNTNTITGTNISSGYVTEYPDMFYRAAGPP